MYTRARLQLQMYVVSINALTVALAATLLVDVAVAAVVVKFLAEAMVVSSTAGVLAVTTKATDLAVAAVSQMAVLAVNLSLAARATL
jgi:hypothetical protein